ncbi:MAG: hypothetical protein ACYCU7_18965, partial [Acidimicrobiales bacterium]
VGMKWMASTNDINKLVKNYVEKYGDRSIYSHIVCREVADMPGVISKRCTTKYGREQYSKLHFGVCIGDPKKVIPGEGKEIEEKTGVKPPPNFGASYKSGAAAATKDKMKLKTSTKVPKKTSKNGTKGKSGKK